MPVKRFTARWIQSLKPPKNGQVDYFDLNKLGKGRTFGLRVSYGGNKSWFIMYRKYGRLRRLTIGSYLQYDLQQARIKADEQLSAIIDGKDPAADKQALKAAENIKELCAIYIERYAKKKKKTWKRDEEILERDVIPRWGERKAKEITRADVIDLLDRIVDRGAGIMANRTLATIRKMFNWAMEREILDHNPCYGVSSPAKEKQRERVLTDGEIKSLWNGLENTDISKQVQIALKLILTTVQRKGEIIGASKKEFDLENNWWTIPGQRTKNGISHRVPLGSIAKKLVEQAFEISENSKWLLPSSTTKAPILGTAVDRAVRRNLENFKIEHFTPHDLRRTAASHMTSMGITRLVVSKVLNHAESGVTAVYDRHSYDNEKRQALNAWSAHLRQILKAKEWRRMA